MKKAISITLDIDLLNRIEERRKDKGERSISTTIEELIKQGFNVEPITVKDKIALIKTLYHGVAVEYANIRKENMELKERLNNGVQNNG